MTNIKTMQNKEILEIIEELRATKERHNEVKAEINKKRQAIYNNRQLLRLIELCRKGLIF